MNDFLKVSAARADLLSIRQAFAGEAAPVNPIMVDGYFDWGAGIDDFKVYPKLNYGDYARDLNERGIEPSPDNYQRYIDWLPLVAIDETFSEPALTYQQDDVEEQKGRWAASLALLFKPMGIVPFQIAAEYCRNQSLSFPPPKHEKRMVDKNVIDEDERLQTFATPQVLFQGELADASVDNMEDGFVLTRAYPAGFHCIKK